MDLESFPKIMGSNLELCRFQAGLYKFRNFTCKILKGAGIIVAIVLSKYNA